MEQKSAYKNTHLIIGILLTVILATFIGTPHTIGDPILYYKFGLNLIIGTCYLAALLSDYSLFRQKDALGICQSFQALAHTVNGESAGRYFLSSGEEFLFETACWIIPFPITCFFIQTCPS